MREALALARARDRRLSEPNPRVGCVIVGADGARRRPRPHAGSGRRARRGRWRCATPRARGHRRPRRDRLRHARAVLAPRPHAAVRRRARRRRRRRASSSRCATRTRSSPVGRGAARAPPASTSSGARRRRIARTQHRLRLAHGARPPLAAHEGGGLARRAHARSPTAPASGSPASAARADGHAWRKRAGAVLTGVGTVREDDPRLDVRLVADGAPAAARGRRLAPRDAARPRASSRRPARCSSTPRSTTPSAARRARARGAEVAAAAAARPARSTSRAMLADLGRRGVNELHVEAGDKLNGSLLAAGLVDELLVYVAPRLLGSGRGLAALGAARAPRRALGFTFIERRARRRRPALLLRPVPARRPTRGPEAGVIA